MDSERKLLVRLREPESPPFAVSAADPASPVRDFASYSVLYDGKPVEAGQSLQAAPGVTLIRRC